MGSRNLVIVQFVEVVDGEVEMDMYEVNRLEEDIEQFFREVRAGPFWDQDRESVAQFMYDCAMKEVKRLKEDAIKDQLQWYDMEGIVLPFVHIDNTLNPKYGFGVIRITKKFYVVRCNEVGTKNYRRVDGYAAGEGGYSVSRILQKHREELERLAEENGGVWNSGWKPKKG